VYLLDHSCVLKNIDNPIKNETYNDIMYNAILNGNNTILTIEQLGYIKTSLKLKIHIKDKNIINIYNSIFNYLKDLYKRDGECSKYMLEKQITSCSSIHY
jgi:hypothetical protein